MKGAIAEALNLPSSPEELRSFDLLTMQALFRETFGVYRSEFARFVGFKTSCGTENFPHFWQGAPGLFIYPRMSTFCSLETQGHPVITTGVYHSELYSEFEQMHPLLHQMLRHEYANYKKERYNLLGDHNI